jgi:WD40 repeat protein
MPLRPIVLLTACLAFSPGQVARSQPPTAQVKQPPPEQKAIHTDRYGDPLPPGALARVGTVRFRQFFSWAIRFSPDGKVLTSVGDGKVYVWDAATGRELRQVEVPRDGVEYRALSPDGTVLASVARAPDAPREATITLLEVSTGKVLHRVRGAQPPATRVAFSPDGKTLALGSSGGGAEVRVWDLRAGKGSRLLLRQKPNGGHHVTGVLFSPDGKTLAAGFTDRKILLWDTATWRLARTLEGHQEGVFSLAFSPDGRHIFSSSLDKTIRRWDVATGKEVSRFGPEPRYWGHFDLAPDGKTLAVLVVRPGTDTRLP